MVPLYMHIYSICVFLLGKFAFVYSSRHWHNHKEMGIVHAGNAFASIELNKQALVIKNNVLCIWEKRSKQIKL